MIKKNTFKSMVAIAICLAGSTTAFAQSNTTDVGVQIGETIWATRNVDKFGTFATNPESSGMFYQWSRTDAISATVPGENIEIGWEGGWETYPFGYSIYLDGAWVTYDAWSSTLDPCPSGWALPTKDQIAELIKETTQTWKGTGVTGYTFSKDGKSLFFPAVGHRREDTGALVAKGLFGYYWASTRVETTTTSERNNAYCLLFHHNGMAGGEPKLFNQYQSQGNSVRCVKKDDDFTSLKNVSPNHTKNIVGYYNLVGQKLSQEPARGIFFIVYDNGDREKVMK